jgi:hypothetical protein
MPKGSEVQRLAAVALERLDWARGYAERIFAGVPDDKVTFRAGGGGNHTLWVMGHLAVTDDLILNVQTGCKHELSEQYRKLFGIGSQPVDNPRIYPSRTELLDALRLHRRRLITWVESLDDETAWKPSPEYFCPFAPDAITTPFGAAAHDLMHAGQITTVRAALGLPVVQR